MRMNIPFENNKEDIKIREEIISQVYRRGRKCSGWCLRP